MSTKLTQAQIDGPYTRFMDMHSGGGCKLGFEFIYIQAKLDDAIKIFKATFDRDPDHISCYCCGRDYSYQETTDLLQASGFDRNCDYDMAKEQYIERRRYRSVELQYRPIDEYIKSDIVKVIFKEDK